MYIRKINDNAIAVVQDISLLLFLNKYEILACAVRTGMAIMSTCCWKRVCSGTGLWSMQWRCSLMASTHPRTSTRPSAAACFSRMSTAKYTPVRFTPELHSKESRADTWRNSPHQNSNCIFHFCVKFSVIYTTGNFSKCSFLNKLSVHLPPTYAISNNQPSIWKWGSSVTYLRLEACQLSTWHFCVIRDGPALDNLNCDCHSTFKLRQRSHQAADQLISIL